jgi:signal transduction histidine kinase
MASTRSKASATTRRRHQSLLFKLFIVLVGAVGLTYVAFGGFYRSYWNTSSKPSAMPSLVFYWSLFAKEIGSPPDTAYAARMSKKLGVPVGIKGPGIDWRTPDMSPTVARDVFRSPDSVSVVLREGRIWGSVRQDGYQYAFSSRRRTVDSLTSDWIALLPLLGLSCLLAWLVLRHLLRPLGALEDGVQAVAEGNLDTRLSERGSDEIAGLGRSFNTMTQRLKDRERARDQLLLDVSHELRSPLTRMRVALEMAAPSPIIQDLQEEVDALGKMVSEILETERLKSPAGALKLEPSNLVDLITNKVARFEGETPGLIWKPVDFPLVPMDPERIRLVLRNLIENALKYGREATQPIEITLTREGGFAVVKVRDHGPGVADDEQALVFEPFYRLDRARSRASGYGLGLPLCRRIIEAHGGTITMQSKPGQGTTLVVRLPLA